MKRERLILIFAAILTLHGIVYAQSSISDSLFRSKEKIKKGWNIGALPALSFDSDLGFQYGAIANLYHYGDGSAYPKYRHSIYLEWSRTTKGSGENRIIYDSEYVIPNTRITSEIGYGIDPLLNFYGFNGYNAIYNSNYEDKSSAGYISRMFYRIDRKLARISIDLQGNLSGKKLRWLAGYAFLNHDIDRVNFDKLNKGKSGNDILPDTTTLFDKYIEMGLIPKDQIDGGSTNLIKAGVVFDTRDNEPNPMKGLWSEVILISSPSFLGNDYNFTKLAITHRQYFTIKNEIVNLAYRISYQTKLEGEMPFYMLPVIYNSTGLREGLGGGKTLRGVLRNRVVGEDVFYGNLELRWKLLKFAKFNQNFYFAASGFFDFGTITGNYHVISNSPEANVYLTQGAQDSFHKSFGIGLYGAMNQNFIAALNYGLATDARDGNNGLYIGLDFLF